MCGVAITPAIKVARNKSGPRIGLPETTFGAELGRCLDAGCSGVPITESVVDVQNQLFTALECLLTEVVYCTCAFTVL